MMRTCLNVWACLLHVDLSDHHGECIYSACSHYQKCYIERGVRRARRADLVIANHALVMVQAVRGALDSNARPKRFVFDEGHHVFDAADSAFSALLSGREAAELRRWLRGAETRGSGRARGLRRRIEDLLSGDDDLAALDDVLRAAGTLPGEGWRQRISESEPRGDAEAFLGAIRGQVYARANGTDGPYDLECDIGELVPGLLEAAAQLNEGLNRLGKPLKVLRESLIARLEDEADSLETPTRLRIESMIGSLQNRSEDVVAAWQSMLESLASETPERFVDWFSVQRFGGRDIDVGMHRHWLDPTVPFAEQVASPAHGLVVTSATLRDGTGDAEADWAAAENSHGCEPFAGARRSRSGSVTIRLCGDDPGLGGQRRAKGRPRTGRGGVSGTLPSVRRRGARALHGHFALTSGPCEIGRAFGPSWVAVVRAACGWPQPANLDRYISCRGRSMFAWHGCGT